MAKTRIPLNYYELAQRTRDANLDLTVAQLKLSVRTVNCLEEEGIITVRGLLAKKPAELLKIANFGEKTLEEVYCALEQVGFKRHQR